MSEFAISLSGGGYRAAMFHLGTLQYLNHIQMSDGTTFLDNIRIISTISGGSITGLWYMMNRCKEIETNESLERLYHILCDTDLPSEAIRRLLDHKEGDCSLIKKMVELYDEHLFHGETFGLILDKIDNFPIHHFSANGTDFSNGLGFRFQASRIIKSAKQPEFSRGFIGNKLHILPWNIAAQIRLSEILAVSSCFPGGFEPMNFPSDFSFSNDSKNSEFLSKTADFDLMDGGIVDNQGIEPILLVEGQMEIDKPAEKEDKCIDLIIVSDVASPYIKGPDTLLTTDCNLSISKVNSVLILLLAVLSLLCMFVSGSVFLLGFSSALLLVTSICWLILYCIRSKVRRTISQCAPFQIDWKKVEAFKVKHAVSMLGKRLSSLLQLSSAVFMKPIRQMRYNQLYNDGSWKNRRISNNVNELSSKGSWKWKSKGGKIPSYLVPSELIQSNSDKASEMGTTLWFTDEDRKQELPKSLLSAGHYTICMNLLEYIAKLKKDDDNTNDSHRLIMECEPKLREDWKAFQKDPHYFYNLIEHE